jgi:hypothetical protein
MLTVAFILGFASYLGSHNHPGLAYLLLAAVLFWPMLRLALWMLKEIAIGVLLGFGAESD